MLVFRPKSAKSIWRLRPKLPQTVTVTAAVTVTYLPLWRYRPCYRPGPACGAPPDCLAAITGLFAAWRGGRGSGK